MRYHISDPQPYSPDGKPSLDENPRRRCHDRDDDAGMVRKVEHCRAGWSVIVVQGEFCKCADGVEEACGGVESGSEGSGFDAEGSGDWKRT